MWSDNISGDHLAAQNPWKEAHLKRISSLQLQQLELRRNGKAQERNVPSPPVLSPWLGPTHHTRAGCQGPCGHFTCPSPWYHRLHHWQSAILMTWPSLEGTKDMNKAQLWFALFTEITVQLAQAPFSNCIRQFCTGLELFSQIHVALMSPSNRIFRSCLP